MEEEKHDSDNEHIRNVIECIDHVQNMTVPKPFNYKPSSTAPEAVEARLDTIRADTIKGKMQSDRALSARLDKTSDKSSKDNVVVTVLKSFFTK